MDFRSLPSSPVTLTNITVPACLLGKDGDLETTSLSIADGQITQAKFEEIDMGGAMVFPCFVDMHTHLDKGHIWPRAANPDGSFPGALSTVAQDRSARWSAQDVAARMDFGLRSAYAHGTRAIRTHIDSIPPQDEISFPVFASLQETWADKIELQASSLMGIDALEDFSSYGHTADLVAATGGVLGIVTYPVADLNDRLRQYFKMAGERGLPADLHVDETGDPSVATLREIARTVLETGFDAPVVVGHCCSLAVQDDRAAAETLDLVAEAGLHVVSLPMCNLYLQDRRAGRTPRWRGITLVHEMKARGINVSFASDNTRDPFYAYGDLDMIEVMRQATRIGHLDHADLDWSNAFIANPAKACGFSAPSLNPGSPADLVICKARNWTELFSRPQSDRIVLRSGKAIDRTLPDYAELDHLMRTP